LVAVENKEAEKLNAQATDGERAACLEALKETMPDI
jgi:hypothetical protein